MDCFVVLVIENRSGCFVRYGVRACTTENRVSMRDRLEEGYCAFPFPWLVNIKVTTTVILFTCGRHRYDDGL